MTRHNSVFVPFCLFHVEFFSLVACFSVYIFSHEPLLLSCIVPEPFAQQQHLYNPHNTHSRPVYNTTISDNFYPFYLLSLVFYLRGVLYA